MATVGERAMGMNVLVCGAGGFIGGHLVSHLKNDGHWVRGVDIKAPEFRETHADEFMLLDLRRAEACAQALQLPGGFDEVYQLAADMGGMGFIHSAECDIMHNNVLINLNMVRAASQAEARRYFYSSSVCIYRDMEFDEPEMTEEDAYPAMPDNEYGWEKLYSERLVQAYGRNTGLDVRVARFQNCYGPYGTWRGGREKAPAAICRKVAEVEGDGGIIEAWGDGTAVRSYTYVDDMVNGILRLTRSDLDVVVNIGNPEYVTVADLISTTADIAGKQIETRYIDGPVGVRSRNFSNARIESLGWKAKFPLRDGIRLTYPWINEQVQAARELVA
ncbi:MAG: NAD-dependent epimerase/dehydratase family protein [Actinomycetota bacterium]|nr:NAD-dependent epimerase/dehydratase family protein [Actinomycetota bacterium]